MTEGQTTPAAKVVDAGAPADGGSATQVDLVVLVARLVDTDSAIAVYDQLLESEAEVDGHLEIEESS